jgi:pimeloyl-ACP methyl ester carboxylesterase
VEIPGSGHLTAVEDPTAVVAALVPFLDDVRRLPWSD